MAALVVESSTGKDAVSTSEHTYVVQTHCPPLKLPLDPLPLVGEGVLAGLLLEGVGALVLEGSAGVVEGSAGVVKEPWS